MTTRSIIFLLGFIICLNMDYSFGEDIVLKSGKTHKNLNVFKQEADRLLVTYPGGMATIYLKDCTEDIQRKYNYSPTDEAIAQSERAKKVQAAHNKLQKDVKKQLVIWKKKQAAKEQQRANDEIKYRATQKENARLDKAKRWERRQKINETERRAGNAKSQKQISYMNSTPDLRVPYVARGTDNAQSRAAQAREADSANHARARAEAAERTAASVQRAAKGMSLTRLQKEAQARRGIWQPAQPGVGPGRYVNPARIEPESQQLRQTIRNEIRNAQLFRQSSGLP